MGAPSIAIGGPPRRSHGSRAVIVCVSNSPFDGCRAHRRASLRLLPQSAATDHARQGRADRRHDPAPPRRAARSSTAGVSGGRTRRGRACRSTAPVRRSYPGACRVLQACPSSGPGAHTAPGSLVSGSWAFALAPPLRSEWPEGGRISWVVALTSTRRGGQDAGWRDNRSEGQSPIPAAG